MQFQRTLSSPIKSVARVSAVIPAGSASVNVTIPAVNPAKAFVVSSSLMDYGAGSANDVGLTSPKLTSATNVSVSRATASPSYKAICQFEVIEYV
jgi:hypothetical protein